MDRLEQLRKLAEMSPEDPMSHYAIGLELIQQERWSEAVTAFDQAIAADENYSAAYYHKGRSLIKANEPAAANETLTKGIEVATAAGDMKTVKEMTELRALIA